MSSGSAVPSLSMIIVRSRLVRRAVIEVLVGRVVGGLTGEALAALWAQVCVVVVVGSVDCMVVVGCCRSCCD